MLFAPPRTTPFIFLALTTLLFGCGSKGPVVNDFISTAHFPEPAASYDEPRGFSSIYYLDENYEVVAQKIAADTFERKLSMERNDLKYNDWVFISFADSNQNGTTYRIKVIDGEIPLIDSKLDQFADSKNKGLACTLQILAVKKNFDQRTA